jgi:hypothetical protein
MHFFHVNHLAVLVSAVIQWVLGALWYGLLFAKPWKAMVGHQEDEKPKYAAFAMTASFIASLILSFVLVHMVLWAGGATFGRGVFVGLVCWLGFMAPTMFAQHIYEHRPFNLFAMNAGYWLVAMTISGGVLAVWR